MFDVILTDNFQYHSQTVDNELSPTEIKGKMYKLPIKVIKIHI
jgi:hypothetical protein